MKNTLVALALLAASSTAHAECMSVYYLLSGNVVQKDDSPAVGVTVGAAWRELGLVGGPALGKTDSQGNYSILIEFKPYSHAPDGKWYECKGVLGSINISAYSDTHYSISSPFSVPVDARELQRTPPRIVEIKADPLELNFEIEQPPFIGIDG